METIEQIAERKWRELNNSNVIPGDSMHAEFARRVVAEWCAQACTEDVYIGRIVALERKLQAVTAEKRTVPEGWKLVPVNPTPAMLEAGKTITEYCYTANGWMPMRTSTYQIMVAAAPEAPK